eukprot:2407773-Prymnesium_polylepis.1
MACASAGEVPNLALSKHSALERKPPYCDAVGKWEGTAQRREGTSSTASPPAVEKSLRVPSGPAGAKRSHRNRSLKRALGRDSIRRLYARPGELRSQILCHVVGGAALKHEHWCELYPSSAAQLLGKRAGLQRVDPCIHEWCAQVDVGTQFSRCSQHSQPNGGRAAPIARIASARTRPLFRQRIESTRERCT